MSQKNKKKEKPTTVLFIRHGENEWTEKNKLAGRTAGVHLSEFGRLQVEALGKRLAQRELHALYASPLERTVETAQAIVQHHDHLKLETWNELLEVDYGDWTGESIKKLSKTDAWPIIQFYPSGASFPNGETMYGMQSRFIIAVNKLVAQHPAQTVAIVGHADLIKSAIAHYLGVHFDLFQRITVSTASITTVHFTKMAPRLITLNDTSHNPPPPDKKEEKKK